MMMRVVIIEKTKNKAKSRPEKWSALKFSMILPKKYPAKPEPMQVPISSGAFKRQRLFNGHVLS